MKKIYILSIVFLLGACSSVQNLYDKGDHEQLIKKVIKKESKRKADKNDIRLLEDAFELEKQNLLAQIDLAEQSISEDRWINIHRKARKLEILQENIQFYLPLKANSGYTAEFEFYELTDLIEEAREASFDYYINEASKLLEQSEQNVNDKLSARRAYTLLQSAGKYDHTEELENLIYIAKDLGTVRIATKIIRSDRSSWNTSPRNQTNNRIEDELNNLISTKNRNWVEYVYESDADYIISIDLADIDLSRVREDVSVENFSDQQRERVLNQNGSVVVDSLGNPTYTYRTVTARLATTTYEKDAEVEVVTRLKNSYTGAVISQRRYDRDATYSIQTCDIIGEDRLVPNADRCRDELINFPPENEIVVSLLREMRSTIRNDMNRAIDRSL